MPQWIAVEPVGALRPGQMRDYELLDGTMLGLANVGGEYRAFDAVCPHRGGPLVGGEIEAGVVRCPWHGHRYDLCSGENRSPGGLPPLRRFPVRIRAGHVEVEVP